MRFVALVVLAAITASFMAVPSRGQKESGTTGELDSCLTEFWRIWDHDSPNAALVSTDSEHRERVQATADQVTGILSRAGKYYGRDEVSRIVIGSRLVRVRYFLRFEGGPIFLDLIYYRPEAAWRSCNFSVDTNTMKVISEMAATHEVVQKFADGQ